MNAETHIHIPVLLHEVVDYCVPPPQSIFVDGTLGFGGHTEALLKVMSPDSTVIGLDRDPYALAQAKERLKPFEPRVQFVQNNFRHIDTVLSELNIPAVHGILLDIGISSYQVDNPERGFSFLKDGPLDMRMNPEDLTSAYDLINALSEKELVQIFKEYGEERYARKIAQRIVRERHRQPLETTTQLAKLVQSAVPSRGYQKIHPATRIFQALRIAVNAELESLEAVLEKCVHVLHPKGRIAIISFHSLEDRIVKHTFRQLEKTHLLTVLTKKPVRPSDEEIQNNPRARSARLRVAQRN